MQQSFLSDLFKQKRPLFWVFFMILVFTSCAPGDPQFHEGSPAGFWHGLWHGVIALVTFVISLFSDTVKMYEVQNNGGWYDFGFILGIIISWGSSSGKAMKASGYRTKSTGPNGEEWEARFYQSCRDWAKEEDDQEWIEISEKVEKKLKRKLKEWAEEE